ncbi:MAG TPA: hypothetical protein V6D50_20610 [Chroococcales cyanobacterium]
MLVAEQELALKSWFSFTINSGIRLLMGKCCPLVPLSGQQLIHCRNLKPVAS